MTEIHEYAFDVKLWAVARIRAKDEGRARQIAKEFMECLDIGLHADSKNREDLDDNEEVRLTEASSEGGFDLFEIDGQWKG